MMRIRFLIYIVVGLVLIGAGVAWVFYMQRGAHMELKGSVLKVRTLATDENSSVALIDFRITNTADYPWVVRSVDVSVIDGQGYLVEGSTISDTDSARLFEYFPLLGSKYNDSLTIRTRLQSRQTLDRMVGVRFEVPEGPIRNRKSLRIRVTEVDGAVSEIVEGAAR